MNDSATSVRDTVASLVAFTLLACVMMWQQVWHIGDSAVPHQDTYFNMWRLHWIAHALATSPTSIFNANIFYPEPRTLLFSDAMLVQGITAAPMIWFGIRPVLVQNIMLLGAIVVSATTMFALVHSLTRSRGAAILAGTIFAFAPYRFEHIMHMELQWTMWVPLAFLALHRTFNNYRVRDGLMCGGAVALQMLSSVYYGIFLATLIAIGSLLLLIGKPWTTNRRAMIPLAAGAVLALALTGAYARPYLHARDRVGERPVDEIQAFAARPADYLVVPHTNWLYGRWQTRGEMERRLFPGAIALLLATVALLLRSPSRVIVVYLLVGVAAFEASLGLRGYSYSLLYEYLSPFRALRAPARLGIFVVFSLAVLAGFGYSWLTSALRARFRLILLALLLTAVLAEYFTTVTLASYPNEPPPVYKLLASQPPGVVAEFPAPMLNVRPGQDPKRGLPGADPKYAYLSIFHWKPLINGYSGFYPASYIRRLQDLRRFPDPFSLRVLRRADVRYVVIHEAGYGEDREAYEQILMTLNEAEGVRSLGPFSDGEGTATVYVLE
ncbi:MAG TPA: hypothetical protein VL882_11410 [Vicinamibacterales bacterium]|jgi:hypothetical protein|nr:hypothetical protein [Vicinamibacterales bacterium]